jgi:hypothetical protein
VSFSAELGSITSSLEQLVQRIDQIVSQVTGTEQEDLSIGLIDVERNLRSGVRRLERLARDLER